MVTFAWALAHEGERGVHHLSACFAWVLLLVYQSRVALDCRGYLLEALVYALDLLCEERADHDDALSVTERRLMHTILPRCVLVGVRRATQRAANMHDRGCR